MGELGGARETYNDDKADDKPEKKDADEVIHGLLTFSGVLDRAGEQNEPHANPEREDAWHPNPDKDAVVMVNKEPEADAGEEADEACKEERIVDAVEHRWQVCRTYEGRDAPDSIRATRPELAVRSSQANTLRNAADEVCLSAISPS